jgi:superfamily I DNA/RNA helicase
MASQAEDQLREAVDRILQSTSRKKLLVAGPGTGKTTVFRKLLEASRGNSDTRLVLTFINNLKEDLGRSLSDLAKTSTLHGYCQSLLHRRGAVRIGLTGEFRCLPGLASLIKDDWGYLRGEPVPHFVDQMRALKIGEDLEFYLVRGNYYDAVDFDDSVFRVYRRLEESQDQIETFDLVLIDEYQDFNRMEAEFIELLSLRSPIVIAGDDDQALYSQLRGSSWDFIRSLHRGDEYEKFVLPFCMRCPEVIVGAVNDVIEKAQQLKKLAGRIAKPYLHFEPLKGRDSKRYPHIDLVWTTVQRGNANYFGRYIEKAISQIPQNEFEEAAKKNEPAVLIIGSIQYLRQIVDYLRTHGHAVSTKGDQSNKLEKADGYRLLSENPTSNLGWRLMLEFEDKDLRGSIIRQAAKAACPLSEALPSEVGSRILTQTQIWAQNERKNEQKVQDLQNKPADQVVIKATSFEGSKGMSAQHVFIVGMHENELPHDSANIKDIEICRFVVGLTRAKKKCSLLYTSRFADQEKHASPFLSWIKSKRYKPVRVNANFWREA